MAAPNSWFNVAISAPFLSSRSVKYYSTDMRVNVGVGGSLKANLPHFVGLLVPLREPCVPKNGKFITAFDGTEMVARHV